MYSLSSVVAGFALRKMSETVRKNLQSAYDVKKNEKRQAPYTSLPWYFNAWILF